MTMKTIYVATPCLNAAETIDRTIMSVLSQAGDFYIRYHVQDGGSTDGTVERFAWWQHQLIARRFPLQCRGADFTYTSEPDTGMYDALFKGLAATQATTPDSFMTWINGDDMFMPGAFEFVANVAKQFTASQLSWVGGAVSVFLGDLPNSTHDRPLPRPVLQAGLCDGTHWDFMQQEGTFFRKILWDSISPDKTIRPLRLAGDWNLWRLFAKQATLVQTRFPLGTFRIRPEQLSDRLRDKYLSEIDALVPIAERRQALKDLADSGAVYRRVFQLSYKKKTISVIDELQNTKLLSHYQKVFGKPIQLATDAPATKKVFQGANSESTLTSKRRDVVTLEGNILSFDANWQFPAITEQHAFHCIRDKCVVPEGITYIAYPWANLIDKIQANASDKIDHLERFHDFCRLIPRTTSKVTVCQHIQLKDFLHLFDEAGISTVFWAHATHADLIKKCQFQALFPFPLYPVQVPKAVPEVGQEADIVQRKYLFSFIGARASNHYLTDARTWILDLLKDDPSALIIGRDSWHYESIVYSYQIKRTAQHADPKKLVDTFASGQFLESLKQSIFSLCPSGSGPNSIRLWESIGAGAIPVILADTWAPPGNARLWEMAGVFCKEDPDQIRNLPKRLSEIASDPERISQMRHAMRQLWLLYGPDSFTTDVQEFILSYAGAPQQDLDLPDSPMPLGSFLEKVLVSNDGERLILHVTSALLLDANRMLDLINNDRRVIQGLETARKSLGNGSDVLRRYDAALTIAQRKARSPAQNMPYILKNAQPKICLLGRHANRTPLSYEPIRRIIDQQLKFVEVPEQADIVISGFNIDLLDSIEALSAVLSSPNKPKFAILSEEPLWDITWSGPFTGRKARIADTRGEIAYTFLSHETSNIFEFERIPYFVLTSDSYAVRYANLIGRFACMTPKDMLERWKSATFPAAFFFERRTGATYSNSFPERNVTGLSAYRTDVAESLKLPGVLRVGKGWSTESRRQDLPDWHLDKLVQADGNTRVLSSLENVHQRLYITEKIFDAFAIGAVPLYYADPEHRVFELVPSASMLNCYSLTPKQASDKIANFTPDHAFAEAWLDTAAKLCTLFSDIPTIQAERRRVAEATIKALLELV
jgi:hypothetical protein